MRIEKPLTPEEAKAGDLIPAGNYQFEVMNAEEKVSKAGNGMIELKLKLWMDDGRERMLHDYIMEALPFKLVHFTETVGLYQKYQEGVLSAHDCIGKCGELKIYIQKDKTGLYADKSSVADYLPAKDGAKAEHKPASQKPKDEPVFDSDVPF